MPVLDEVTRSQDRRGQCRRRLAVLAFGIGGFAGLALFAAPAFGDEFPKRKPGLWEMRTTGGPVGPQTIQQCIDASTDDLLRMQSNEGQNCSKPAVEREGSRYRVRSSCTGEGMRSTMDGVYTMSRDTEYRGDMKMTFDPPLAGAAEMNMKMDGKWLGPCKAGMKPGDIVMQGMPRMNVLEMGKGGGGITPEQARQMAEEMMKNMTRQKGAQPQ
jgi:hypothetical protein